MSSKEPAFGAATLLEENGKVLFENLFSPRHFGRVADLVVEHVRGRGPDELRLRAILLFAMFEAFHSTEKEEERAKEPMAFEFGYDAKRIALGLSFQHPGGLDAEGAIARVSKREGQGAVEETLQALVGFADRVRLRHQPSTGRTEILATLGIGSRDREEGAPAIELEVFPEGEIPPARTGEYEALGDTNYAELLKDDRPGAKAPPAAGGELIVKGAQVASQQAKTIVPGAAPEPQTEPVLELSSTPVQSVEEAMKILGLASAKEEARKVGGSDSPADAAETVGGGPRDEEASQTVGGGTSDDGESETHLAGDPSAQEDVHKLGGKFEEKAGTYRIAAVTEKLKEEIMRVSGATPDSELGRSISSLNLEKPDDQLKLFAQAQLYLTQIGTLSDKVRNLEAANRQLQSMAIGQAVSAGGGPAGSGSSAGTGSASSVPPVPGEQRKEAGGFLGKFWPFKKKKEEEEGASLDYSRAAKSEDVAAEAELRIAPVPGERREAGAPPATEETGGQARAAASPASGSAEPQAGARENAHAEPAQAKDPVEPPSETEGENRETEPAARAASEPTPPSTDAKTDETEKDLEGALKPAASSNSPADQAAAEAMGELQSASGNEILVRMKDDAEAIKSELKNAASQRVVDGLMTDLMTERARIQEGAKKLMIASKTKEVEFKRREAILQEEIRRRNDLIRQRNFQLEQAKDLVAHKTAELAKRGRAAVEGDANLKHKLIAAEKAQFIAKEENQKLLTKLEELRKVAAASQAAAKKTGPSSTEHAELQQKTERMARQMEEMRRINQQLNEKLSEKKDKHASVKDLELKKKVDDAQKAVELYKKEAEKLRAKMEETQKNELRMKMEMNRLKEENQKLLNSAKNPKAGTRGPGGKAA